MAFSRQLAVVGILGACFVVAVGCGDDDGKKTNDGDAGEGGEGSGGKSQGGSSSTTAGKGGTATAGSGTAGSSTAGSAGSATQGGEAGSGGAGTGGSMAGEGGSAVSGAGAGGEAGAGGAISAATECSYKCETDSDCNLEGEPSGKLCDEQTKTCLECKADAECIASKSFWFIQCEDDAGCTADTEACVEVAGQGYCAPRVDLEDPEEPCPAGGLPISLKHLGSEGDVSVCAADARCVRGECGWGCGDPTFGACVTGSGDQCNTETGLCECTSGTACTSGVCGADKKCGCAVDEDCASLGLDKCEGGVCGCASADSCIAGYDGATPVCE